MSTPEIDIVFYIFDNQYFMLHDAVYPWSTSMSEQSLETFMHDFSLEFQQDIEKALVNLYKGSTAKKMNIL